MNDELRAAGDALADELERTTGISDPDVQEMVAAYRAARDAAPADEIDRLRARVAELEAALEAQSEALRDEGARSRAYEQEAYDNWCAAQEDR